MSKKTKTDSSFKPSKTMKDALKAVERMGEPQALHDEVGNFLSEAVTEAFESLEEIKKNKNWH